MMASGIRVLASGSGGVCVLVTYNFLVESHTIILYSSRCI